MDAMNPITSLKDFVTLQQGLWAKLLQLCGGAIDSLLLQVPANGFVYHAGQKWSFRKHGTGVLFSEEGGKRRVDLHDISAGADQFDAWRLATYLGGLGREGDKFINRLVGVGGPMEQRVAQWLAQLVAEGALVQEGSTFRLAERER